MKKKRLEAGQDFPRFLKHVRKEQNVLLEQLSRGLMTVSNLARIEKGQSTTTVLSNDEGRDIKTTESRF